MDPIYKYLLLLLLLLHISRYCCIYLDIVTYIYIYICYYTHIRCIHTYIYIYAYVILRDIPSNSTHGPVDLNFDPADV